MKKTIMRSEPVFAFEGDVVATTPERSPRHGLNIRRVTNDVMDAQSFERLALQDISLGLPLTYAADNYDMAMFHLARALHHCDRRARREIQRNMTRLGAKSANLRRKASL